MAKQNERYLVNQVKDIIAKKRSNKLTLLMTEHPVVISITDEEIAAIAAHMTNIKSGRGFTPIGSVANRKNNSKAHRTNKFYDF